MEQACMICVCKVVAMETGNPLYISSIPFLSPPFLCNSQNCFLTLRLIRERFIFRSTRKSHEVNSQQNALMSELPIVLSTSIVISIKHIGEGRTEAVSHIHSKTAVISNTIWIINPTVNCNKPYCS